MTRKRRSEKTDVRRCQPCGEGSPYQDFIERTGAAEHEEIALSMYDFLPSTERRDGLLNKIRAALPLLTARQQTVIMALGQGQTYREIAKSLHVNVAVVQREVDRARAIIAG